MKIFLIKIVLFVSLGIILGEGIVRLFELTIDVPVAYVDSSDHLIKYRPNQTGNYIGGDHKWIINKYGNFGYEPPSLDSLITVIGDSFISNEMNPPSCHQARYLSLLDRDFNYYPMSRDGASFIEYMEMKKSLEHLHPIKNLFYVHHSDFTESIIEVANKPTSVQYSINEHRIRYAKLSSRKLKRLLYHFKLAYYLYRNYLIFKSTPPALKVKKSKKPLNFKAIKKLLDFVKNNYSIDDIILVFNPNSDQKLIKITKNYGFKTILLKAQNYSSWKLEHDSHWSCNGHKKAAIQVTNYLKQNIEFKSHHTNLVNTD